MRNIWVSDSFGGHYEAIDGVIELTLGDCGDRINDWKKRYFKSKNVNPATIQLRCFYKEPEPFLWTHYLELLIKGQIVEKHRIREEAFDALKGNKPKTEYPKSSVLFIEYETFTPLPQEQRIKKVHSPKTEIKVIKSIWDFDDNEPSPLSSL